MKIALKKKKLMRYLCDLGRLHVCFFFFFYEGDCSEPPMENNCRKWFNKWLSQQIGTAMRFSFLICNVRRKRFHSVKHRLCRLALVAQSCWSEQHFNCTSFILYVNVFWLKIHHSNCKFWCIYLWLLTNRSLTCSHVTTVITFLSQPVHAGPTPLVA